MRRVRCIPEQSPDGTMKQTENFKRFVLTYIVELHREYDDNAQWMERLRRNARPLPRTIPRLAIRMTRKLITGGANKDSQPIKRTCKTLGLLHTYKALRAYLTAGAAS
jgi:hypothetical protein